MNEYFCLPTQEKYAIAYFDLLGVTKKMENQSEWAPDWIWIFYKNLMLSLETHKNIKIKSFSDNVLICEKIDDRNPKQAILNVLSIVDDILMQSFTLGALFFQGGIVVGDLFINENFAYGQGLLKAYHIQNDLAITPRVIIDSTVLDILDRQDNICLKTDDDGFVFYDFLQSRINKGGDRVTQEFRTLAGNIIVNLKSKSITESVINKMNWIIKYYNNTCSKNGMPCRILNKDI